MFIQHLDGKNKEATIWTFNAEFQPISSCESGSGTSHNLFIVYDTFRIIYSDGTAVTVPYLEPCEILGEGEAEFKAWLR